MNPQEVQNTLGAVVFGIQMIICAAVLFMVAKYVIYQIKTNRSGH